VGDYGKKLWHVVSFGINEPEIVKYGIPTSNAGSARIKVLI